MEFRAFIEHVSPRSLYLTELIKFHCTFITIICFSAVPFSLIERANTRKILSRSVLCKNLFNFYLKLIWNCRGKTFLMNKKENKMHWMINTQVESENWTTCCWWWSLRRWCHGESNIMLVSVVSYCAVEVSEEFRSFSIFQFTPSHHFQSIPIFSQVMCYIIVDISFFF